MDGLRYDSSRHVGNHSPGPIFQDPVGYILGSLRSASLQSLNPSCGTVDPHSRLSTGSICSSWRFISTPRTYLEASVRHLSRVSRSNGRTPGYGLPCIAVLVAFSDKDQDERRVMRSFSIFVGAYASL